jgi:formate hydrogenlyase subunit 3/multisubunit Na+/H+ antiporter MnhD subunit
MVTLFNYTESAFAALVALTLLGPLLLALLVARFPASRLLRALAPLTVLPALVLALGSRREWYVPEWVLGVRWGVDDVSAIFLLFSGILWLCASWFGVPYLARDAGRARYTAFFLVAQAGNLGLILAQDMATFYFCFALMSFASYVLVVHDGQPASQRAGRIYLSLAIAGEVLQFIAFSIIALQVPDGRLSQVPAAVATSPYRYEITVLLLVSLGIKAGLVPLHVWLPLAHPVAPTPASAVLSGAMIKAGLLGWIRFLPLGEFAWPAAGEALIVLGLTGSLGGAVLGVTQRHPKAILAYSSISQMGLIIILMGLGLSQTSLAPLALAAALVYAVHHGLAKGVLFLGVGLATSAPGGAWGRRVLLAGCACAGLALAGAPWTSGMLAKIMLKNAAGLAPGDWAASLNWMLSLAAVGTTLLMARFLVRLRAVALEDGHHRHEAGAMIWMPWLVLLAASLGVVWLAVPELTGSVIAAGFKKSLLWKLCGPVAAGVILALAVAGLRRQARPWVEWPAGDVVYLPLKVLAVAQIAVTALVQRLHTGCCLVQQSQHRVAKFLIEHSSFLSRVEARLADFALLGLALLLVAGVAAWML